MSVAHEKPEFETFLDPIINELKMLEYGINFNISANKIRQLQFFLLFAVFDKPARASILNMVSMTG